VIFLSQSRIAAFSAVLLLTLALHAQSTPLPPGSSDPEAESAPSSTQTTGPLVDAEAAIDAKDYGKARGLLDAYLSAHPTDARALFDRGYCDDAQGHADSAVSYYRKAIAAYPQQFEARMALGLLLAQQNSPDARAELEAAVSLNPDPPNPEAKAQAYRTLAHLLHDSDPDAAKNDLLAALKLSPETPDDTLLTAEIAEAEGDRDIAEQAYRRVLSVQPESSPAIAGLVHLLIEEKNYAEAEPLVHTALLRDPDDPALNAQYAALLAAQGKPEEATATLEKLHQLQPQNRQVSGMLADAYMQGGMLEKADAVYANLLTSSPDDANLLSARGQVLIREQNYPQALALFQHAVKINPKDADAWGGIAFAASKTGDPALELDALATRSKYTAETPATYFLWATAHDKLHHTKQAVEYYHLFLSSALGKFPDEEWQAKQRLAILQK
jgi:tetratricopeptide (TPR) repeat protein